MTNQVLWDIILCYWCFGQACCFHFQGEAGLTCPEYLNVQSWCDYTTSSSWFETYSHFFRTIKAMCVDYKRCQLCYSCANTCSMLCLNRMRFIQYKGKNLRLSSVSKRCWNGSCLHKQEFTFQFHLESVAETLL